MSDSKNINNIITISGEPVSGKSTTIKGIQNRLIQKGLKKENIHILSTGEQFRTDFNDIIDFFNIFDDYINLYSNLNLENLKIFKNIIKNSQNIDEQLITNPELLKCVEEYEKLKNISQKNIIKKIIKNSEYRNILQETIMKFRNRNIDLRNFSIEDANNSDVFEKLRKIVDTIIDTTMKEEGQKINKDFRPNDFWIIDSRLAFNNVPNSFSVRLTIDSKIAAKRLIEDETRGKEDNNYKNEKEAENEILKRKDGEIKRYKERYGIDLTDTENYQCIIDTSYADSNDIVNTILDTFYLHKQGEKISKKWASPKQFIPMQTISDTFRKTPNGLPLPELVEKIEEEGFKQEFPITAIEVDGRKYIIEGHHRNFATIGSNNTLLPYEVIARDEEIVNGNYTAKDKISYLGKSIGSLYDHEALIEDLINRHKPKNEEKVSFTYEDIYPNIYKYLKELDSFEYGD